MLQTIKHSLFIAAAVLSLPAMAQVTVEGAEYPAQTEVAGSVLHLNGAGLRKKVFFKVYAAGLYLPQISSNVDSILGRTDGALVRLTLLRNVSASSFVDALKDGLTDNTDKVERERIATDINKLIAVMNRIGDVKTGDTVDFAFAAGSTSVSVNGRVLQADIGSRALFDAVLRIWLGEHAIDSKLKTALLGNTT